jgi:hypothetical protein
MTGHFAPIVQGNPALPQEQWIDQYGATFKIKGFFGVSKLICPQAVINTCSTSAIFCSLLTIEQ